MINEANNTLSVDEQLPLVGGHLKQGLGHLALELGDESDEDQKLAQAEAWLNAQEMWGDPVASVPADISSQLALLAQRRINVLQEDGFVDEESMTLESIRDHSLQTAETLDFELVESAGSWALMAQMNAMHGKFNDVSPDALTGFLGDGENYEYKALFIRDIVADHAPALLTENLRAIGDESQPMWRRASAQASIILSNRVNRNMHGIEVEMVPTSLPSAQKMEYSTDDDQALKLLAEMDDDELALYAQPGTTAAVRERGHAMFNELTVPAREALLTRKLFESGGKSRDQASKDQASERNRAHEHEPMLKEGDLVHAMPSTEVFDAVLTDGLRCGEAVMGNDRAVIQYPFSVSFLEVSGKVAEPEDPTEKLKLLQNEPYGSINLVMSGEVASKDYVKGHPAGVINQRQIFGGVASTNLEKVIVREHEAKADTVQKLIKSIVGHNMFVPVYDGLTGEQIFTSAQFDELTAQAA
jgi:hypothetical protein